VFVVTGFKLGLGYIESSTQTTVMTRWRKSQTLESRSSEASVNADFELISIDIRWRQTDRKDGVSVADWSIEI